MRAGLPEKLERFVKLIRVEGLSLVFDKDLDTLFIHPGKKPGASFLELLVDGIYAEFDPDSEEIVGFEIQEFSQALASTKPANAAFGLLYPAVVHYGTVTLPAESDAPETAVRDLYRALGASA